MIFRSSLTRKIFPILITLILTGCTDHNPSKRLVNAADELKESVDELGRAVRGFTCAVSLNRVEMPKLQEMICKQLGKAVGCAKPTAIEIRRAIDELGDHCTNLKAGDCAEVTTAKGEFYAGGKIAEINGPEVVLDGPKSLPTAFPIAVLKKVDCKEVL